MPNTTVTIPTNPSEIDSLIEWGVLAESLTYPSLPMAEAMAKLAAFPDKFNLTALTGVTDPQAKVQSLIALLPTLSHDQKSAGYIAGYWVATALALAAVGCRLHARKKYTGKLRLEDKWAIVAASFSVVTAALFTLAQVWSKACHHIWDIPFTTFQKWLLMLSLGEVFFAFCLIPCKIVFLIFYHSLSPDRTYRRILIFVGTCVIAITLAGVMLMALQCKPINIWNHYFTAKCIDRVRALTIWGILTIVSDFVILALPISKVIRLNLQMREKIIIVCIFSSGAIVCIASILRVITLNQVITATDKPYEVGPVSIWSLIEINLALTVSCLPALKHLVNGNNATRIRNAAARLPDFVIRSIRWGNNPPRRPSGSNPYQDTDLFKDTGFSGVISTGKTDLSGMSVLKSIDGGAALTTTITASAETENGEQDVETRDVGRRIMTMTEFSIDEERGADVRKDDV